MNEFEKNLPKDKIENLRKLTAPDNAKLRKAERNKAFKNKGTYQIIQNLNDDNFIEALSQPTRKKKDRRMNKGINSVGLNGYSYCENTLKNGKVWKGSNGIINPIKLNISTETLNKIK